MRFQNVNLKNQLADPNKELHQLKLQLGVWTRTKRNSPWSVSNLSPPFFFKPRKIVLQLLEPIGVNCHFVVTVSASDSSTACCCFLSDTPSKCETFFSTQTVMSQATPPGTCKLFECYLHRKESVVGKHFSESHLVAVELQVNGQRFLLHSWTTKPVRSHKWESSNRGREININNATQLLINVSYDDPPAKGTVPKPIPFFPKLSSAPPTTGVPFVKMPNKTLFSRY